MTASRQRFISLVWGPEHAQEGKKDGIDFDIVINSSYFPLFSINGGSLAHPLFISPTSTHTIKSPELYLHRKLQMSSLFEIPIGNSAKCKVSVSLTTLSQTNKWKWVCFCFLIDMYDGKKIKTKWSEIYKYH